MDGIAAAIRAFPARRRRNWRADTREFRRIVEKSTRKLEERNET
jgi:hypothetical protein